MGYYTRYALDFDAATAADVIAAFKQGRNYFGFDEEDDLRYGMEEPTTWYDFNEDMRAVSTLLPNATLILSGEGEEQGDVWRKTYRGGKCIKTQKARLVFDDGEEVK